MSKHTAGPWHIVTSTRGKNWVTIQGEQGRFVVKPDVRNTYGEDGELLVDSGVWMKPEDARLIAAAPELLDALERVEQRAREFGECPFCHQPPEVGCAPACPLTAARAAIKKARGEG